MRKKTFFAMFLLAVLVALSVSMTACKKKTQTREPIVVPEDFSYFRETKYKDHLYVIKENILNDAEKLAVVSLQGITAQLDGEGGEIYLEDSREVLKDGEGGSYNFWLKDFTENYGKTYEYVDSLDELILKFKDRLVDNGFILCSSDYHKASSVRRGDDSVNVATTIAGVEKWLIVDTTLKERAETVWGLTQKIDVTTGTDKTKEWVFEEYKDKLINDVVFHLNPVRPHGRDFAIALKALTYYGRAIDEPEYGLAIYDWAKDDIPYLGWGENEVSYVAQNSQFGAMTISIDWSYNTSFTNSLKGKVTDLKQKYDKEAQKPVAQEGKHYLAIVMTDGDNPTWLQSGFINDKKFYGSPYRGEYKMTWGMSPSLIDIMPNVIKKIYDTASPNDEFISGASGTGYINPSIYKDYELNAARTNHYYKLTDLSVIDVIDSGVDRTSLEIMSRQSNIKGGTIKYGNKYKGGGASVYWFNDKPFVTIRESMWQESPINVATRINSFEKNYKSINGYTVMTSHCWSSDMNAINTLRQYLSDDVELVTVRELIEMVTENVPHVDVKDPMTPVDYEYPSFPDENIDYKALDAKEATAKTSFAFDEDSEGWVGKTPLVTASSFDTAKYDKTVGNFAPGALTLDGSDLGKGDQNFNSYFFNKITLPDTDELYFNYYVRAGASTDANHRVRVFIKKYDGYEIAPLTSWIHTKTDFWVPYSLDISKFKGQTVVITLEQDDDGEGSGEFIAFDDITIGAKTAVEYLTDGVIVGEYDKIKTSAYASWYKFDDWTVRTLAPTATNYSMNTNGITFATDSTSVNTVQSVAFVKASINSAVMENMTFNFGLGSGAGANVKILFVEKDGTETVLKDWTEITRGESLNVVIEKAKLDTISGKEGLFTVQYSSDGKNASHLLTLNMVESRFSVESEEILPGLTNIDILSHSPDDDTKWNVAKNNLTKWAVGEAVAGTGYPLINGTIGSNGLRLTLSKGKGTNDGKADLFAYNRITLDPSLTHLRLSVISTNLNGDGMPRDAKYRLTVIDIANDYAIKNYEWSVVKGTVTKVTEYDISEFANKDVIIMVEMDDNDFESGVTDDLEDMYISAVELYNPEERAIHNGISANELRALSASDTLSYTFTNQNMNGWESFVSSGTTPHSSVNFTFSATNGLRMAMTAGTADGNADIAIYKKLNLPVGVSEITVKADSTESGKPRDTKVRITIVKISDMSVKSFDYGVVSGTEWATFDFDVSAYGGEEVVLFVEIDKYDGTGADTALDDIWVYSVIATVESPIAHNVYTRYDLDRMTVSSVRSFVGSDAAGNAFEEWKANMRITDGTTPHSVNGMIQSTGLRMTIEKGKGTEDGIADITVANKFAIGSETALKFKVNAENDSRDVKFRVTIVDVSSDYAVKSTAWKIVTGATPTDEVVDLTEYAGKTIVVLIELDANGSTDGATDALDDMRVNHLIIE